MVEESIYEGKGDEMFDDIKSGAGFATYDYVLNAKHSPLSQKERVRLMIRLAKIGILIDDRKINGNPTKLPRQAIMSLQDLEKRYKSRTNPKNESIDESRVGFNKLFIPNVGNIDDWKLKELLSKNKTFIGNLSPEEKKFFDNKDTVVVGHYFVIIITDGKLEFEYNNKTKKVVKPLRKARRGIINHWKELNESNSSCKCTSCKCGKELNEMSKPNFKEFQPVTGKYDFAKLSNLSDMGKRVKISKKEFDSILQKLEKWGVDVFRDDHDDFYTIFSYGDNYNLVKVKVNESVNEARDIELKPGMGFKINPKYGSPNSQFQELTIKLVSPTSKGWKVKQTYSYSPSGKKLRKPKTVQGFYNDDDFNGSGKMFDLVENINEANFGYKDGSASYMKNHKDEFKTAQLLNKKSGRNEMKFYDTLTNMEDHLGHPKYMVWLSNSLRGFNVDMYKDPKIKNKSEAEEALYLLSK